MPAEVGCTNRTHLEDYAAAVTEHTGAILVAHQSNFRIVGFTTAPELSALAGAEGRTVPRRARELAGRRQVQNAGACPRRLPGSLRKVVAMRHLPL